MKLIIFFVLVVMAAAINKSHAAVCWISMNDTHGWHGVGYEITNIGDCLAFCVSQPACSSVDWDSKSGDGLTCWLFETVGPLGEATGVTHYILNRSCAVDWTKSLLIASTGKTTEISRLISLIGNPTYYAPLIANVTNDDFTGLFDDNTQTVNTDRDFFHTLSVDYDAQLVYYGDNAYNELASALFVYGNRTTETQFISIGNVNAIKSVSLDWVSKNLYWTQGDSVKVIRVGLPSTRLYQKTLVSTDLYTVSGVVVNPLDRYLFWCDLISIERSDLSGNGRIVLYTNASLRALSLTIDYTGRRLFYLSDDRLGWMNYDGSNHFYVAERVSSSLAIHENVLMLGNYINFTVDFYRIQGNSIAYYSSLIFNAQETITDIAMFSRESQPVVTSPCSTNNGGCEHFCFTISSTSRVCGCDNNFMYTNGTSCLTSTSPLITTSTTTTTTSKPTSNSGTRPLITTSTTTTTTSRPTSSSVDMTKSLLIASTGKITQRSRIISLFGDPTVYAPRLNKSDTSGLIDDNQQITSANQDVFHTMSVDYDSQLVYYGDNAFSQIASALFIYGNSTADKQTFNIGNTRTIKDISLDWVSKNLYWTQGESVRVMRVGLSSTKIYDKVLVSTNVSTVESVVVNPLEGFLFWCDSVSIERSDLAGNGRTLLYTSGSLRAVDLTIDYVLRRLYYLSDDRLGWMNYDGSNHVNVPELVSSSLAIHGNILFLGHTDHFSINIYQRQTDGVSYIVTLTYDAQERVTSLAMFSRESQPAVTSPCRSNNGGCDQFCFTASSTTKSCGCDSKYTLKADGTTCKSGFSSVRLGSLFSWSVTVAVCFLGIRQFSV